MATITPANHFHDPRSSRPHSRRNSTRRSFASALSRSSSYLDSPRTACPKDGDAFAYKPTHLKSWYCPQPTWDRLPSSVQKSLAAVQHAGASALTGMFLLFSYYYRRVAPLAASMRDIHPCQNACVVHIELTYFRLRTSSRVQWGQRWFPH